MMTRDDNRLTWEEAGENDETTKEEWQGVASDLHQVIENLRANGTVTTGTSTATAGSTAPVIGKLTVGYERGLKYHIFNDSWRNVKFIPNLHVFEINPEIMQQARRALGLEEGGQEVTFDASLMARYKYEINQKRSNVKTAVRKKYRGKYNSEVAGIRKNVTMT
jgi:hypothetical protein